MEAWLDNVEELMADAVELTTNIEDTPAAAESCARGSSSEWGPTLKKRCIR